MEMRPNADLDAAMAEAVGQLTAAAKDLRPNELLDSVFGTGSSPQTQPGAAAEPGRATAPGRPVLGPAFDPSAPLPAPNPLAPVAASTPSPSPPAPTAASPPATRKPVLSPIFDPAAPLPAPNPLAGGVPPTPQPGGASPADVPRLVRKISDDLVKLLERVGRTGVAPGQTPPPPDKPQPGDAGYSWGDATRPVTNWLRGTRVGQIGERAFKRIKPAVEAARKAGRATAKGPAKPKGGGKGKPPGPNGTGAGAGGAKPPIPPAAGGSAAAGAEGAAAGGAAGGAAAAGAAVPVVGVVVAVTAALIELAGAAKDLAYQQEARTRELAQYNATQAAAAAQLDVDRVRRSVESGAATANSSSARTESQSRFEDAARPFEDAADSLKNILSGAVLEVLTDLLNTVRPLAETLNEIAEKWLGPRDPGVTLHDQLRRTQQDYEQRRAATVGAAEAARRIGRG